MSAYVSYRVILSALPSDRNGAATCLLAILSIVWGMSQIESCIGIDLLDIAFVFFQFRFGK